MIRLHLSSAIYPKFFKNCNIKIIFISIFFCKGEIIPIFDKIRRHVYNQIQPRIQPNSHFVETQVSFYVTLVFVVVFRYVRVSLDRYAFRMDVLESRIMRSCGRQRGTRRNQGCQPCRIVPCEMAICMLLCGN